MAKIAIINNSSHVYNYATHKMLVKFTREGHEVFYSRRADMWSMACDQAYLSAIFTYDLPDLVQDVNNLTAAGVEVEVGGPAATALPAYIEENTGVTPHFGLDERFELVPGKKFRAIFTSRGCPRACEFCLVPILEGRKIVEYDDFPIPTGKNPWVCDNNILATSWEHQKLVVRRLKGVRNLDLNSGFDDRIFIRDPEKYWQLYNELDLEAWRFAYDKPEQEEAVKACADFLHDKGVDYRHIIVFCLVGGPGTEFEECRERLQYLIDIGCSPYPMRYRPLDSVEKDVTPPGWDRGALNELFGYYGVPYIWRKSKWENFSQAAKKAYRENKKNARSKRNK